MTDQQKVQLLPCPWCGSHKVGMRGRCIECASCGAGGPELPLGGSQRDMDALWNTRQAALAHASSATTNPQESSSRLVDAAVLAELTAWLTREMPAGTIISSPGWWAKRIAGRVHIAIDQAIAGRRGDGHG